MQVIKKGHHYELEVNGPTEAAGSTERQFLMFVHKEEKQPGIATLDVVTPGTTNEEVLDVLIDRMEFLQNQMPSDFNTIAIDHLRAAKVALDGRTADRQNRGVEGTNKK